MNSITEELLFSLTECQSLAEINVLSLRSKNLTDCLKTISKCPNLLILYLQNNRVSFDDLDLHLINFKRIQKLDLSSNHIKRLPEAKAFRSLCPTLKILYLHDNMIAHWNDLNSISKAFSGGSSQLIHLTLMRNPVSQMPGYRHFLVNSVRTLLVLDEYVITDEEKIQGTTLGMRFRALSPFMKIHIPYFQENQSAEQHLFNLAVDVYRIRRIFERNSPSIKIQAWFRGHKVRKQTIHSYGKRKLAAISIQKVVRGWLFRKRVQKDLRVLIISKNLGYLLLDQTKYREYRAKKTIERALYNYIKRKRWERLMFECSTLVQQYWRAKNTKNKSFIRALRLEQDHNIYILKEQKTEFVEMLKRVFPQEAPYLSDCISPAKNYQILRYPNPLTFKNYDMPLLTLIMPTLTSRVKHFASPGFSSLIKDGQSLCNFYTRFRGMERERKALGVLKNRLSHVNTRDTSLVYEVALEEGKQVRKVRKTHDNYQELLLFKSESKEMTIKLCQEIIRNNLNHSTESFLPFFPFLMLRVSAAIHIQQSFRSFLIRKEQREILEKTYRNQLLSQVQLLCPPICEFTMAQCVLRRRAAICISQYWKYYLLKYRIQAQSGTSLLYQYFTQIMEKEQQETGFIRMYLEEQIYLNVESIVEQMASGYKHPEMHFDYDFIQCSHLLPGQEAPSLKVTQEDGGEIELAEEKKNSYFWEICINNTNQKSCRFIDDAPIAHWCINYQPADIIYHALPPETRFKNNVLGLFHLTTLDQRLQCRVLDYNEIVNHDKKSLSLNNGLKFVETTYCSVQDAQKRFTALILFTASIKSSSQIRPLTKTMIEDGVFIQNLIEVWNFYGLRDGRRFFQYLLRNDNEGVVLKEGRDWAEKQKRQQHSGILLSEKAVRKGLAEEVEGEWTCLSQLKKEEKERKLKKKKGFSLQKIRTISSKQEIHERPCQGNDSLQFLEKDKLAYLFERQRVREVKTREADLRREVVKKTREINQAMKEVVRFEQDVSIRLFQKFSQHERELFGEIKKREEVRRQGEVQSKRSLVLKQVEKKRKGEADREFVTSFHQVRNIISKQSNLGEIMKFRHNLKKKNAEAVKQAKENERKIWSNSCQVSPVREKKKAEVIVPKLYDSGVIYQLGQMAAMNSTSQKSSPVNMRTGLKIRQKRVSDGELPFLANEANNSSMHMPAFRKEKRQFDSSLQQNSSKLEILSSKMPRYSQDQDSMLGKPRAKEGLQEVVGKVCERAPTSKLLNRMTFIEEHFPMDFHPTPSQFH